MRRREIAAIAVAVSALTACGSHHTEWPVASITNMDDGCYRAINADRTARRTICGSTCYRGKYEYNYRGRAEINPMDEACRAVIEAIKKNPGL